MILEVDDLSYRYHNSSNVFNGVSFSLDKGEVLSILGVNGAGKSTLLNCIGNLFRPATGEIRLNGKLMSSMHTRDIARVIGYVPQSHTAVYGYSVREYVVMGRTPFIGAFAVPGRDDYRIADEALEKMEIKHLGKKLYTEISGGERQQVMIAKIFAQQPQLILLDEPTAHLDYGNQHRVVEMIRNLAGEGYAMIMTTHNPEHAFILDGKVAILNRSGVLCVGDSGETLTTEILSSLYSLPIKTKYDEDAKRNICVVC